MVRNRINEIYCCYGTYYFIYLALWYRPLNKLKNFKNPTNPIKLTIRSGTSIFYGHFVNLLSTNSSPWLAKILTKCTVKVHVPMSYTYWYNCNENFPNYISFYSALSTCSICAQFQARGRLGHDKLESLSSLWNGVINDLHFDKLMPFAINKIEHLGGRNGFQLIKIMQLQILYSARYVSSVGIWVCVWVADHFAGVVIQSLLSLQVLSVEKKRDISICPLVPVGH